MPTGYTYPVVDGKVTDLRTFVLQCARAFGAAIHQRDEDMTKLPRPPEVSDFKAKQLAKYKNDLTQLRALTPEQVVAECDKDFNSQTTAWEKTAARTRLEDSRVTAMIEKVSDWNPPTKAHEELKTFMLDQLSKSLNGDWVEQTKPEKQNPEYWYAKRLEEAARLVGVYSEKLEEEKTAISESTKWINGLYESLGSVIPTAKPKS